MYGDLNYDFSHIVGAATIGVLSDTHGRLSAEAFKTLASMDPDVIIHAGDICGDDILPRLEMLAPVVAVLGNNDYSGRYGPSVRRRAEFDICGVSFTVVHIASGTVIPVSRVLVCGHTHIPSIEHVGASIVVNPGSVTRPRGSQGPTVARIDLEANSVRDARIVPVH